MMPQHINTRYSHFDCTQFPIVVVRIQPITPTEAEFDEYVEIGTDVMRKLAGGVIIHNVTEGKFLTSRQRIAIGNLYKDEREMISKLKGMGYVNSAFIPMTMLKGIFLINKPPVDYTVVSTEAEAIVWAKSKLSK
jgi:hypothetical protein